MIVDVATLVAAASVGLDVSSETVPYVAGWGENGALEAVSEFAKTIDELARQVEDVLRAAQDAPTRDEGDSGSTRPGR